MDGFVECVRARVGGCVCVCNSGMSTAEVALDFFVVRHFD